MEEKEKQKAEPAVIKVDPFRWKIPECCQSDSLKCRHVVQPVEPEEKNIGL